MDNLDAAEKYEQYLTDQMGEYEDGRYLKELQKCWIYLKICRPGPVDSDSFFLNMKKMRGILDGGGMFLDRGFYAQSGIHSARGQGLL